MQTFNSIVSQSFHSLVAYKNSLPDRIFMNTCKIGSTVFVVAVLGLKAHPITALSCALAWGVATALEGIVVPIFRNRNNSTTLELQIIRNCVCLAAGIALVGCFPQAAFLHKELITHLWISIVCNFLYYDCYNCDKWT